MSPALMTCKSHVRDWGPIQGMVCLSVSLLPKCVPVQFNLRYGNTTEQTSVKRTLYFSYIFTSEKKRLLNACPHFSFINNMFRVIIGKISLQSSLFHRWSVVTSCWSASSQERPKFSALVETLTQLLDSDSNYIQLLP